MKLVAVLMLPLALAACLPVWSPANQVVPVDSLRRALPEGARVRVHLPAHGRVEGRYEGTLGEALVLSDDGRLLSVSGFDSVWVRDDPLPAVSAMMGGALLGLTVTRMAENNDVGLEGGAMALGAGLVALVNSRMRGWVLLRSGPGMDSAAVVTRPCTAPMVVRTGLDSRLDVAGAGALFGLVLGILAGAEATANSDGTDVGDGAVAMGATAGVALGSAFGYLLGSALGAEGPTRRISCGK